MVKNIFVVGALLVSGSAFAQQQMAEDLKVHQDPASYVTDSPAFDTIVDAAKAGLAIAAGFSKENHTEYCGAIIRKHVTAQQADGSIFDGEKFFYTNIVTNSERSACNFRVLMYKGNVLVGMFHVHPRTIRDAVAGNRSDQKSLDDQSLFFSPEDIKTAQTAKVQSFIYFEVSNEIRVFTPGKTRMTVRARDDGRPGLNQVSVGDVL